MGFFGNLLGSAGGTILGAGLGQAIGGRSGASTGANIGGQIGRAVGDIIPFRNGGKVPGPQGMPVRAVVHGGETVLPIGVKPTKAQRMAIRRRGGRC